MKLSRKAKIILGGLILTALLLIVAKVAKADTLNIGDEIKKIPALKQGIAYSLVENDFNYLSTFEALAYRGATLELGYSSEDKVVTVLSYELLSLKKLGVTTPILDLVYFRPGVWFGVGKIQKDIYKTETDYGVSCTILSLKF